jgi:hypothetical protein
MNVRVPRPLPLPLPLPPAGEGETERLRRIFTVNGGITLEQDHAFI